MNKFSRSLEQATGGHFLNTQGLRNGSHLTTVLSHPCSTVNTLIYVGRRELFRQSSRWHTDKALINTPSWHEVRVWQVNIYPWNWSINSIWKPCLYEWWRKYYFHVDILGLYWIWMNYLLTSSDCMFVKSSTVWLHVTVHTTGKI